MSQVQILQAPHAAKDGRQRLHQRPEPPSGLCGNSELRSESLRGFEEQRRGGSAEQRAAPLDGFVRQPSALLDHLVPAGERVGGREGAVGVAAEEGAPMCECLCACGVIYRGQRWWRERLATL